MEIQKQTRRRPGETFVETKCLDVRWGGTVSALHPREVRNRKEQREQRQDGRNKFLRQARRREEEEEEEEENPSKRGGYLSNVDATKGTERNGREELSRD